MRRLREIRRKEPACSNSLCQQQASALRAAERTQSLLIKHLFDPHNMTRSEHSTLARILNRIRNDDAVSVDVGSQESGTSSPEHHHDCSDNDKTAAVAAAPAAEQDGASL